MLLLKPSSIDFSNLLLKRIKSQFFDVHQMVKFGTGISNKIVVTLHREPPWTGIIYIVTNVMQKSNVFMSIYDDVKIFNY